MTNIWYPIHAMKKEIGMLTIKEAAELVDVSRQTIYNWINEGVLGFVQKGHFRLLDKDAVLSASEIMANRPYGSRKRRGPKN